jgi:hypothetical protein
MSMRDSTANDSRTDASRASLPDALRAVALPFLVTRVGVLVVGVAAAVFIGYTPEPGHPSAWRLDVDPVRNLLARWDTYFYLDIATHGYQWNGNPLKGQNVVFFPLYPLLMRGLGMSIGGHPLLAGLIVSLAAFLLAMLYFWRWTADRLDADTATGAVWLLSVFPLGVFFSAAYRIMCCSSSSAPVTALSGAVARTAAMGFLGGLSGRTACCVDPDRVDRRSSPPAATSGKPRRPQAAEKTVLRSLAARR